MTSSVAGQRSAKALPRAKLAANKGQAHSPLSAVSLIHYGLLNPGETITSEKSAQQTDAMHQNLQCLQPTLVNRNGPIILQDNTQLHATQPTLQKLNKLGYEILLHPPYSFDLSPTNYHFFKHLNNFLRGKHFHNQQEAENAFQEFVQS